MGPSQYFDKCLGYNCYGSLLSTSRCALDNQRAYRRSHLDRHRLSKLHNDFANNWGHIRRRRRIKLPKDFKILGERHDLSDVLRIARAIGKSFFNVEKVNVLPAVYPTKDGYIVYVRPEGDGHSKASDVGGREKSQSES